jgi:hypothetical protein
MHRLSNYDLLEFDRRYFSSWPRNERASFVGIDPSAPALAYAKAVGLLVAGVASDLEKSDPELDDVPAIEGADLVISTGCVGYVTEKTFTRIMECQSRQRPPMIASFVLRMFPYDDIASAMARYGMVTEKLDGVTFVQRRFNSSDEFNSAIDRLENRGIDPRGKEADGLLHAELFVTRPAESARALPLREIVSIASGVDRRYGRRFRRFDAAQATLMQ